MDHARLAAVAGNAPGIRQKALGETVNAGQYFNVFRPLVGNMRLQECAPA
jgi:hypothetical protein